MRRMVMLCAVVSCLPLCLGYAEPSAGPSHRTDWFVKAQWGVFTHYLTDASTTAEAWNRQVDEFDVGALARQLELVGARYYVITLGQNSGHFCSPNAAYDRYVGIQPSKCSKRDLIADIHAALAPKGIALMLYLPCQTPNRDPIAQKGFGLRQGPIDQPIDEDFARKWAEVIQEWSSRYGKGVVGWWFDGAYQHVRFNEAIGRIYADAARAGNAESIVTFNPGVSMKKWTEAEDYTAGEINDAASMRCDGRWVEDKQWHMLSFLGPNWGQAPPRFSNEKVVEITGTIIRRQGVVTWDVPIEATGTIPQSFVDQLAALNKGLQLP